MKKKKRYEIILAWKSDRVPYKYQKLGFSCKSKLFSKAWVEAKEILRLIRRGNNYTPKECRIIALSEEGALKKHEALVAVYTNKQNKDIQNIIKKAKELPKQKPKIKSNIVTMR